MRGKGCQGAPSLRNRRERNGKERGWGKGLRGERETGNGEWGMGKGENGYGGKKEGR